MEAPQQVELQNDSDRELRIEKCSRSFDSRRIAETTRIRIPQAPIWECLIRPCAFWCIEMQRPFFHQAADDVVQRRAGAVLTGIGPSPAGGFACRVALCSVLLRTSQMLLFAISRPFSKF
jgi:hypothetical protein